MGLGKGDRREGLRKRGGGGGREKEGEGETATGPRNSGVWLVSSGPVTCNPRVKVLPTVTRFLPQLLEVLVRTRSCHYPYLHHRPFIST